MRTLLLLLFFGVCSLGQPPPQKPPNLPAIKQEITTSDERIAIYTEKLANFTGKLALYTLVLAAVTAGLVLVGVFQFLALKRQADTLQHHSRSLRQSVIQIGRSVSAYRRYGDLTNESNEITRSVTELTRQSLILMQRPRLIVRNVVLKAQGGSPEPLSAARVLGPEPPGLQTEGHLTVVNIGNTVSTILQAYSEIVIDVGLPMQLPYDGRDGAKTNITLPPGVYTTIPIPHQRFDTAHNWLRFRDVVDRASLEFYIMGWVDYVDDLQNRRRTSFCRKLDAASQRFLAVTDPDYEHAD